MCTMNSQASNPVGACRVRSGKAPHIGATSGAARWFGREQVGLAYYVACSKPREVASNDFSCLCNITSAMKSSSLG